MYALGLSLCAEVGHNNNTEDKLEPGRIVQFGKTKVRERERERQTDRERESGGGGGREGGRGGGRERKRIQKMSADLYTFFMHERKLLLHVQAYKS